eukprot:619663-Alexandrium_andersonii.AAC.1
MAHQLTSTSGPPHKAIRLELGEEQSATSKAQPTCRGAGVWRGTRASTARTAQPPAREQGKGGRETKGQRWGALKGLDMRTTEQLT